MKIFLFSLKMYLTSNTKNVIINNNLVNKNEIILFDKFLNEQISEEKKIYNVVDLIKYMQAKGQSDNYDIVSEKNNTVVYENNININISIYNYMDSNQYECNIKIGDNNKKIEIDDKQTSFSIELIEGKNNIEIELYENDEKIKAIEYTIYYVKPYEEQFLDELSKNGIEVHYDGSEDYNKSSQLLKSLGAKYIRTDFFKYVICPSGNNYNYDEYDYWMKDLTDNTEIKVLAIIDGMDTINSEKRMNNYIDFFKRIEERYPQIERFEIINEPDFEYKSIEAIEWYTKTVTTIEKNSSKEILIGGLAPYQSNSSNYNPYEFYKLFNLYGGERYNNNINFHLYDIWKIEETIKNYEEISRKFGGFNRINITEYGASTSETGEESQARTDVKDTIKFSNCNGVKILYNLWSTKSDNEWDHQLGILNNDYTPKLAYYSMKNFYENTNGAEYIGQIDLGDQIEAHVYDKDGRVKIIAWTNQKSVTQQIENDGFVVSDLYGKNINEMENNITVSYDPIYLDVESNSNKYFFQAISNALIDGYNEFEKSYTDELKNINGIQTKINELRKYSEELNNKSDVSETEAQDLMLEHFELGNMILNSYKDNNIVDETKVSGMLDSLNEIGNSFEDLVTVTAKTRMEDLTEVNNNISNVENLLSNNAKIDILYSDKILDYAKEFRDISEYVLSLNKENAIKTGLINSKAIHANELAKWSLHFSKIQIQKKISPLLDKIKTQYDSILKNTPSLLNNSNIAENFNKLIQFVYNYEYNLESIKNLNDLFIILEKSIIDEYLQNTVNQIENSDINVLVNLEGVTSYYKDLFEYYENNTNLNLNDIEDSLNSAIIKYNDNKNNLNLNISYNFLNLATDLYNNELQTDDEILNYLNAQRISNIIELSNYSINKASSVNEFVSSQREKISINYSTTVLTNNSVSVHINLTEGSKIQNNDGLADRIFEKSESFDFIILTNGITYSITANVGNIVEDYIIDSNNILQINKNTTINSFITSLGILDYKITRGGKELSSSSKIQTGDVLLYNGGQYNLIVNGDIDSDGDVTIHDLIKMRKFLVESKDVVLNEQEKLAADTDQSKIVNIKDLINIRKIIVK